MPTVRSTPPGPTVAPSLGDVVARIAAEVATPLTAALDRVVALASSGRIDRQGLQALRDEIAGARRVGLRGQQIARFATGDVSQVMERLDLAQVLRDVLRDQPVHAHGSAITGLAAGAEVMGDASLVHALLHTTAEWSAALARANVEWRLDIKPWPVHARVICRFAHLPADEALEPAPQPGDTAAPTLHVAALDTLDWLLLAYTAQVAGVAVSRQDSSSHTVLTLEFLHTVNGTLEGTVASAPTPATSAGATQAIKGCQVLVLSAHRLTRQRLREAVHGHDLLVDYVSSVAAAQQFCEEGAPQMLVYEATFQSEALQSLCARLASNVPATALIEVLPTGHDCQMGNGLDSVTRIGADGLRETLVPVMALEMGRVGRA